ncbi:MAG: putative ABC transport system permease protein [Cyclobacteriaceae bacterium]|jgi:putative ABC transport system permease protein
MTKTFILSILRNLWKNRVTSVINVLALTLGLSSTLFIWIQDRYENSFDIHQPKAAQIYRVNITVNYPNQMQQNGNTQSMLAKVLRMEYPELDGVIQVVGPRQGLVTINPGDDYERVFEERNNVFFADSSFLKHFDYDFIAGNKRTALDDRNAIVLSSRMVEKYYPDFVGREAELLGRPVGLNDSLRVFITGVIENPPSNSNLPFELLVSSEVYYKLSEWDRDNWGNIESGLTFVVLKKGQRPSDFEARFPEMVNKYRSEEDAHITTYSLLNLTSLHSDPKWGFAGNYTTNPSISIGFTAIGLFILLSACINFINIQTAQVMNRSKEVGVRKVLGGTRLQLILQFLAETFLLTAISFLLALWMTELALNGWNELLSIVRMNIQIDGTVLIFGLGLIVFVSLISGIYPALKLSSFQPSEALRSGFSAAAGNRSGLNVRQILVVTQFTITQLMIIGTIVISLQMDYFINKDLGFDKEEMITVTTYKPDRQKTDRLTQEIEAIPEVISYSFSSGPPFDGGRYSTSFVEVGHEDKGDMKTRNKFVDHRYIPNYKIDLLAGRNFRKDEYNDSIDAFIVNEALVKQLDVDSPQEAIGKQLVCYGKRAMIIGVTNDFHADKLDQNIQPLIMFPWNHQVDGADLKIASGNLGPALDKLRAVWLEVFPTRSFEFKTVDDFIKDAYLVEDIMLKSIRIFALLAICIGCLGLYGLVSFMSIKRTKEIGIRKVMGASFSQILYTFSRRFFILTIISFVIAAPLAYMVMDLWLNNYVFRVPLSWDIFGLGLLITMALTMLTVGYISLKTARTNPAETLKTE